MGFLLRRISRSVGQLKYKMDLLEDIKDKAKRFPQGFEIVGLKAVILHIETAEKYFKRAKYENDENLYTDVIYRTNHAYEGILKEAYTTLAEKKADNMNPYQIEDYFVEHAVFNNRVLNLFSSYRKEWRNVSTHDYKLFFNAQEAFLAINNVSAFISILLDQIIEKANYIFETKKVREKINLVRSEIENYDSLPLFERIKKLLVYFYKYENSDIELGINKNELSGKIAGFLETIDDTLSIERDKMITHERGNFEIDLVISGKNEKIVVELKRIGSAFYNLQRPEQQVFSYLYLTEIQRGILFVYRPGVKDVKVHTQPDLGLEGKQYSVTTIAPKE